MAEIPHIILNNDGSTEGEGKCVCWRQKSTLVQFIIFLVPMFLLLAGFAAMTTLYVLESQKGDNSTAPTTIAPVTTLCDTADCVTAAGTMLLAMDQTADPCDDFYQYSCGGFNMRQSVPAGQNRLTQFDFILNLIQKELRGLLDAPAPAKEAEARTKARKFYLSCLNRTMINEKSVPQMLKLVDAMGGLLLTKAGKVPDSWTLDTLLAKRSQFSLSGFFSLFVGADDKNVSTNIIQISQGGLGIGPDTRDYYLNSTDVTEAYTTMLTTYAKLILGDDKVDVDLVKEVIQFERRLAEIQQPQDEMRDVVAIYNKVNVTWLQNNSPFIQWKDFFNSVFQETNLTIDGDQPVLLYATPYLTKLTNVVAEYQKTPEGKRTIQNYVVLMAINDYGSVLGDDFQAAFYKFQGVYTGRQGAPETWQTCVSETDQTIGFALGGLYVDNFFGADAKKKASFVIDEIIASFRKRVTSIAWMDEATKKEALGKMDLLQHDVAFPDWIDDDVFVNNKYANLAVSEDFVANQFASFQYQLTEMTKSIHSPPDPRRWTMTPPTVNAYYEPTQNKFVVPAGILNPVFFFKAVGVPDVINFAAIGTVTGHEITHGFDDQGAQYDKYGNLNNWWNNATMTEFNKRTKCIIDQYDAYPGPKFQKYASGDLHIRGLQTLGENIADNGGIRSSFQAFKAAEAAGKLNLSKLIGLTNLTPDQLFFVGYAQVWCGIYTPQALRMQILGNVHSPNMFRVIGPLSNSPDFTTAYGCKPGSNMNPDPQNRCEVW